MSISKFVPVVLVLLAPATACAHGLHMELNVSSAGNFFTTSVAYYGPVLDPVEQDDSVFEAGSYTVNSVTTDSLQYTAGFFAADPPNPIAIGSTWGFDLVGPLLFWDPVAGFTDPKIGSTDVVATIVRSGNAFTVDKNSTFVAGGDLATSGGYNGNLGFHNSVTVNLPLDAPVGLYAIGFDVRSTGATSYGTSDVFYAIGTNGLSGDDFNRGIAAFQAIGVPEPGSVILAALGSRQPGHRRLAPQGGEEGCRLTAATRASTATSRAFHHRSARLAFSPAIANPRTSAAFASGIAGRRRAP